MNYLLNKADNYDDINLVELTTNDILTLTGMCNIQYINGNKNKERLLTNLKNNNMRMFDIDDFYRRTSLKFNKIVDTMINNLMDRCILDVKKIYKIHENGIVRMANTEEECLIIDTKREVLNSMGFIKMQDIYLRFKTKEFYNIVSNILKEKYNWKKCYMVNR
jgi:hypothetical protein